MKAIIYSRVSTTEQKENGFSLQDQEARLRRFCNDKGYEVVKHYQDDHSAKDFQRPAFQNIITDLMQKKIMAQKLICVEVDRFSRNAGEAFSMIGILKNLGVEVEFSDGGMDTRTPEGKFLRNIKLSMAELDNDLKGKRTRAGLRQAQREGRWVNSPPRGYSRGIGEFKGVLQPNDKAKWVMKAFEEVAKGIESIEKIRLKLGKEGFRVPKSSFHVMLTNPVYTGKIRIQPIDGEPEEVVIGLHKPIITDDLFNRVQQVIKGRRKANIRRGSQDPNLPLRGHLICPKCGKKLTGSASKNRTKDLYYYYHCQNGCSTRFNAQHTNQIFIDYLEQFSFPKSIVNLYYKVIKDVFQTRNKAREVELCNLDRELQKLRELEESADEKFVSDQLDRDTYSRLKNKYKDRSNEVHRRIMDIKLLMNDYERWAKTAFRTLPHIANRFRDASIDVQHKILCSIFPGNLEFDGKKYRTHRLNEVFALICNNDKGFGRVQKKQTGENADLSSLAPLLGLEPRTL